jgi:23S rRNA (cytosine1962-C5)-methyltransferase
LKPPVLVLPAGLKKRLSAGHPWVYRDQLPGDLDLTTGTWVRVRTGGFSAWGSWDNESPIAVRLFSRLGVPDAAWVAHRVAEAWDLRSRVRAGPTNAYRWVFGESDGLPGIVVDLYGAFAAIRTYSASIEELVPWVAEALHAHMMLEGIVWRRSDGPIAQPLWGRPPPQDLVVEENGLLFGVDLEKGQKTGFYCDQRDNRLTLEPLCAGKTMLDAFCYTGGFSLYALRGGATAITACDAAAGAIETAKRNLRLNDFGPDRCEFVTGDCFELLEEYGVEGKRFDVVVLDPPSFARASRSRYAALRSYERLNRLALRCVREGGLLASASCTSQVSPSEFRETLAVSARGAGCRLLPLCDGGQPPDHPVPVHFPEARYLKFVVNRVLPIA